MSRLLRPRVFVPLALVAVFLAAGWTVRNQLAADREGEWVRVTRGDLVTGVDVTGTLASAEAGSFGPPQLNDVWDFKISMMAPEGSEVTAGRPILGFDTSDLQRRLEEKSAEAEQARKEIEKRRADLHLKREDETMNLAEADGRLRKTAMKLEAPPDLTANKERKQVELDYALSRQETTQIRSRLGDLQRAANAEIALLESKQRSAAAIVAETQDAIRRMTVLAPRSGTVVYTTGRRGDKKKVGDSCWRMEKVIEIPDLNRMVAEGDVDEVDAGKTAMGQRVKFHLDAHPDEEFHGTITTVAKTVQQQQGTTDPLKVLRVKITLDRSDPATMRPGMRFQGTVELGRIRNAVLIPASAVFTTAVGTVAYRRSAFDVQAVPVRIGRQNGESVEVLSGLRPGDRILVARREGKGQEKS